MPLTHTAQRTTLLIGKESTGKSQLIAALTGQSAYSANFRGSTVRCETYVADNRVWIDTPGIFYRSDSKTTQTALSRLKATDTVVLVVKATHAAEDLTELLPLVAGQQGVVVMTFWDKVGVATPEATPSAEGAVVGQWAQSLGLSIIPVNARQMTAVERQSILRAVQTPSPFPSQWAFPTAGWRVDPMPTLLEHPQLGWMVALLLLLLPAVLAVWLANGFAAGVDPLVQALLAPMMEPRSLLPGFFSAILWGPYGLLSMGPLLLVWAVPTVVLYALFLGAYKASGLVERLAMALHPLLQPLGLSGRDLIRVIMGFGCNVPAVISTRSCSSCTRQTCMSAIAFGSACSYQFGATLAVFSAASLPWLVVPYLLYLGLSTLIYTRLVSPKIARSRHNWLVIEHRTFLERPSLSAVWREARGTLQQFFTNAIPIFVLISAIASLLDWLGLMSALAAVINPLMGIFRLPAEAALPVILSSIRKDGLLLFAEPKTLAVLTPLQILTGVYLAGVLLPCLVTALTIAREQSPAFALKLMGRQALAAVIFSWVLAWSGTLISAAHFTATN